jgi:hypothetical protein
MASCNDIGAEIKELQDQLDALESAKRGLLAGADLADAQPKVKPKVLKTFAGDVVEVDPGEWVTQAEMDAMRMGDEKVTQMVQAGFAGKQGPRGRTGRMVNYAQLDPSEANIASLLEVMGLKRAETVKGLELRRPFTNQVAAKALMQLAQQSGADPRKVAELLQKRVAGIDNLPAAVYSVAKARWDSAIQYSDSLSELADAIDGNYLTDELKNQAGNAAKWAHFYEQMDAQVRRRVGQSLKSLQFGGSDDIQLIDVSKDIADLTIDEVKGNSLVGDMLKLVTEANANELRKRAVAKRLQTMNGGKVNESGFMAELRTFNILRKANLLSALSTWAVRNPVSGALVQAMYMAEDTVSGGLRGISKHGLLPGVSDGLQASAYAGRAWTSAFGMSWGNTWEMLRDGKATMGDGNAKYLDSSRAFNAEGDEAFVNGALEDAWGKLKSWQAVDPINTFNLVNASIWKVFGEGVKKTTGSDAGFMAPFRLLAAGDELTRTQAYVWKANHEAFLRAAEEGRPQGKDARWIESRADELAEEAIFSGVFTDDQLADFRKGRNREFGIPAADELPDDELRAMLYSQYRGVPNKASDIGRIASNRTDDIAFTNKLNDPISQGVQQMRQNPVVDWMIPFWKVPINGIGWVLNRDVFIAVPKQLLMEANQLASRGGEAMKYTPEQMADARARTVVAATLAASTHLAWENGVFTDGGPSDPRQNERWRRNNSPYSFSLAGTIAAGIKVRGNGVDVIDLMGLQADVMRAWHEGLIKQGDASAAMQKMVFAYAQLLKNKAALKNITSVLNVLQDPERYDFADVLGNQMGGILPMSGFLGHFQRGDTDPNLRPTKMRFASAEEMAALGKDPVMGPLQPVMDMLKKAVVGAMNSYPVLGDLQPREKDWLGNTIERPLGLPLDQTVPFMPVIKPQDQLYGWLERHGFGEKPKADGKFTEGGVTIQMSNEEEAYYREHMRTAVGTVDPEAVGIADGGRLFSIAPYVQGQDMQGALRKLMKDPQYNAMLNSPAGQVSPSLTAQPGKPLAQRLKAGGEELYAPIDDIIKYYDKLALMGLIKNQPSFAERWRAVARKKQQGLQEFAASASTLGIGRQ